MSRSAIRKQRDERTQYMWHRAASWADLERRHPGAHPLWDATIVGARYGGIYEGARWMAWPGEPEWLDEHQSGDDECETFWMDYGSAPIGRGDTPNDALADLARICRAGREAFTPRRWPDV